MNLSVLKMFGAALALVGAASMAQAQAGPPGMPGAGAALEVGVITLEMQDVPQVVTSPGRLLPSKRSRCGRGWAG